MNFDSNDFQVNQTCWTLIHRAADGDREAVEDFARFYEPIIRAYLSIRWNNSMKNRDLDDAVQDVFVACFGERGALNRVDPQRPNGFRAFLFGVIRNIARRHENKHLPSLLIEEPLDEGTGVSAAFEREFARSLMRQAAGVQNSNAQAKGPEAIRRHALLGLRFRENLPIREIARRWEVDAAWLHHQYATAREEFRAALKHVIKFHQPESTDAEIEAECLNLIKSL